MKPDISVIIPTYNCQDYICRAIDSVLNQNVNFEIIIVDDASTDDTQEILKKYSIYSNIQTTMHLSNQKQGAARNTGLKVANGEYIFFLDSDDWISEGALEHLQNVLTSENSDVVACGVQTVTQDGTIAPYYGYDFSTAGGLNALEFFSKYMITSPAWAKLYRKSFLIRNKIQFTPKYWHEDILFSANISLHCSKYVSIKNSYYNYFINNLSTTHKKQTLHHLESYFYIYREMVSFINKCKSMHVGNEELYKKILRNYCSAEFIPKIYRYSLENSKEKFESDVFSASATIFEEDANIIADSLCFIFENYKKP